MLWIRYIFCMMLLLFHKSVYEKWFYFPSCCILCFVMAKPIFLFSYLQHCRSKNLLEIWFLFLPISLFGYFCFTHYTENSFFMQETGNHLDELQLKETNQYFIFVSPEESQKEKE